MGFFDEVAKAGGPAAWYQQNAQYMNETQRKNFFARLSPEAAQMFRGQSSDTLPDQLPPTEAQSRAPELPMNVAQKYMDGELLSDQYGKIDKALREGSISWPRELKDGPVKPAGMMFDALTEKITGDKRSTPTTDAAEEWDRMPELMDLWSGKSWRGVLSTLASGPEETEKIIKYIFPNVKSRRDEKGNIIFTSAKDGKDYAIKPGLTWGDVGRGMIVGAPVALTGGGATLPVATLVGAGEAALHEGLQSSSGGDFDPLSVVAGGALGAGGALLARAGRGAKAAAAPMADRTASTAAQSVDTPFGPQMTMAATEGVEDLTKDVARAARRSPEAAQRIMAAEAAPDPLIVEAAERLGIREHLQPDHVSSSVAFRQLAQLAKSQSGSRAFARQAQGLEQVARKIDDILGELGSRSTIKNPLGRATLDDDVMRTLKTAQSAADESAKAAYRELEALVPASTPADVSAIRAHLQERLDIVGGPKKKGLLKPIEKRLLAAFEKGEPTYGLLDDMRKEVLSGMRGQGLFKDEAIGRLKKLYGILTEDQERTLAQFGPDVAQTWSRAKAAIVARKGLEDDLTALFGKSLEKSLTSEIDGSIRAIARGDTRRLASFIRHVPPELRKDVVASGLATAMNLTSKNSKFSHKMFADFWGKVTSEPTARAAFLTHLPKGAGRKLDDLARVSRGIANSLENFIATGKSLQYANALDKVIDQGYDLAARAAGTVGGVKASGAARVATTLLKGQRTPAMESLDAALASLPEMMSSTAARQSPEGLIRKWVNGRRFRRFANELAIPEKPKSAEAWVRYLLYSGGASAEQYQPDAWRQGMSPAANIGAPDEQPER